MSWISYLWQWFSEAFPAPIRFIEIAVLFLTLLALAFKQIKPEWVARMDKLAWQIPLGLLAVVFIISLFISSYHMNQQKIKEITEINQQLEIARKQAYPPVTALMMESYFKDKDIPLGDFGLVNSNLQDKTFEKCRIHGTVVIHLENGNTISLCKFSGNLDSNFIVTTNKSVSGVLNLNGCTFIQCDFQNVSFIGDQKAIDSIKTGFNF